MKKTNLLVAAPILGIVAMLVRGMMYSYFIDDRGLLMTGRPEVIYLAVLTLAAVVLCFLTKEPEKTRYRAVDAYIWFLMAFLWPQSLSDTAASTMRLLFALSRYVGAALAAVLAYFAFRKKKPVFGLSAGLCVCFILRLVASYQVWSRDPQIQDYIFELLACLCLTAFFYQQTALEAGLGSKTWRLRFGFLGCYLCLAACMSLRLSYPYLWFGTGVMSLALAPAPEATP